MELGEIFKGIFNNFMKGEELYSVVGTATDIDEDARTCDVTPLDGSAPIFGVRLQASQNSTKGVVFIPKDKSNVTVTFINKDTGYISQTTEVEKIIAVVEDDGLVDIKVNDIRFQMDKSGIVMNGGTLEGLPILANLVDRLNKNEEATNKLAASYDTHVHPITFGAPASVGASSPIVVATGIVLVATTKQDLENSKVKQ